KSGIVSDAAHLFVFALDHPIFESLQFLRRAVRAFQHIAIDKARGTGEGSKRGLYASRKVNLAKPLENDLASKIIVCVFVESENYIGQPIQRYGALDDHLRHAVH